MKDIQSLSHSKWRCQYHIVFAPQYRRNIWANKRRHREDTEETVRAKRCGDHRSTGMPDHIHMLVKISPKMSVSGFVGFLKGKSTLLIFERHANLKYKYGNRTFWCRGYFVDTAGKNDKAIAEYIKNQLVEDQIEDQMTLKEYTDPFTGSK